MLALVGIGLVVFLFIGVPIATSLGLISVLFIIMSDFPVQIAAQRMYAGMTGFAMLAMPFFILSGTLMEAGGVSKRLINFVYALVGHKTGGLTTAVILSSIVFSSLSGSGAATTAAVGAILIPAMIHRKYSVGFSAGLQASAGQFGIVIPPSIAMVLYGVATETSIGGLFMAGFLPGLVIGIALMIQAYIRCRMRGYVGTTEKASLKDLLTSFRDAIWALLMPVIVLGGIFGGIFTPTEAAVVSVVYAFIIGTFVYREITWEKFKKAVLSATITNAMIMIVIANVAIFSWILTRNLVPHAIAAHFAAVATNRVVFLLMVNLLLLFIGLFFDVSPAMLIIAPILLPIAVYFDIHPIHFGIIMTVNLGLGQITPPMGVNLFVACRIANTSIEEILKETWPIIVLLLFTLALITYIPDIAMFLPRLMNFA